MRKTFTTTTADPLGALDEIKKHRALAAEQFKNPAHVGTNSSSKPDKESGGHIYTITSTWEEGPAPEPEATKA